MTGTINIDGTVGAIGGLASKTSAVMQRGARYFLVPSAQGEATSPRPGRVVGDDVEIIPVATLDEALAALAASAATASIWASRAPTTCPPIAVP